MKTKFPKLLLVLATLLFLALSFTFVYLYRATQNNTQKANDSLSAWTTETSRRESIRALDRSVQLIANDRTLLETHFAQSSDVVPFLDTLEKLAPLVGANAQVNSVDASVDGTGLIVGLNVSGPFGSVYKFLTLLENSPYELNFISMDIHRFILDTSGQKVTNLNWQANFKIQLLTFTQ